ncbi:MAG: SGNH/GDSL hydrolase family protein [Leptothrix sp. (in: b-proteobacteria)]
MTPPDREAEPATAATPAARQRPSSRMLQLLGPLLAPLLWWQKRQLQRLTPVLAEPPVSPQGLAGVGFSRLRLLIVGDSSAAGVGVDEAAQAFAPMLAQALTRQLSAGPMGLTRVSWQLVARTGLSSRSALAMLAANRLEPADVLVTVLGVNDVLEATPPARWLHNLDALRSHAMHRAKIRYTVHCAAPRMELMAGLHAPLRWVWAEQADRLEAALARHLRHAHRRCVLPMPFDASRDGARDWLAADGFHANAALYARWAEAVAARIELELTDNPSRGAVLPSGFTPSTYALLDDAGQAAAHAERRRTAHATGASRASSSATEPPAHGGRDDDGDDAADASAFSSLR